MYKTIQIIVLAALCLNLTAKAQNHIPDIKPLKIGDTIPEAIWNLPLQVVNHPEGKKAITLNDYKGELIILDFWATWCGPCVKAFPKLDSLQMDFKENVQFLLVNSKSTGDNQQKVVKALADRDHYKERAISLPSLINDTIFGKLFIHKMLPHYVWILDNKILATSFAEDITHDNIYKVLSKDRFDIENKIDITDYNQEKPLFLEGNGGNGENLLYRSQISGIIRGLPSQTSAIKDKNDLTIKYTSINATRIELYKVANKVLDMPDNRVYLNKNSLNIVQNRINDHQSFCYELISKPITEEQVNDRLKDALLQYFGLKGIIESKMVNCLILKKADRLEARQKNNLKRYPGGMNIQTDYLSVLLVHLNNILPIPIVNESDYLNPVDFVLPVQATDLTVLKEILRKQGFEIIEGRRKIEVFVIKDNEPEPKANLSSN